MRLRCGFFALLAAAGLMLFGCGKANTTPPPGTDTNTPTVNIDEGDIVAPDEIIKKSDVAAKTNTPGKADPGTETKKEGE
jgi:hypothetical protein